MKKKNAIQVFAKVATDYTDPETGNITINCFPDTHPDTDGRVVAEVTPDGAVIKGTNPEITEVDFQCPLVINAIQEAKKEQEERKQQIVDDLIEELKKDLASGDYTVLDEILKLVPSINLIQALPEEKWSDYSLQIN